MNKRLLVLCIIASVAGFGAVMARGAEPKETVSLDKLPAAVQETFKKTFPKGEIFKLDVDEENGVTVYDLEFKDGKIEKETDITADGIMLEFTVVIEAKAVPKDAMKAIRKAAEGATIKRIEEIDISYETKDGKAVKLPKSIMHYAVELAKGDQTAEVVVDPAGALLEPAKWSGAKEETSEFVSKFDVDKANLTNVGANPYFIPLEPGYRLELKGGGGNLTITVSTKTKKVDGVETRIIEEREEKDGQLLEISQNYFAIDKKTNDVYYFGEDVDIYKDGKVENHEGSWLSGVNGATFGLMMPGKPKLGQKYQQEVAPKVAMDRFEIAAMDEKVETPAGTFNKCLRTKEGSSLESGVGEKIYAPGVGLIKDDEFSLVKIVKPSDKK